MFKMPNYPLKSRIRKFKTNFIAHFLSYVTSYRFSNKQTQIVRTVLSEYI